MESKYILIKPASIKKRKRVGCGPSSGHGKTSCRGQKGQKSRSGYSLKTGFEGGQMPLQRRTPKRGFNNYCRKEYQIINVSSLQKINLQDIDPKKMKELGLIRSDFQMIKVLGVGELKIAVKVVADAFSKSAIEKIKKAGGEAIVREYPKREPKSKVANV